MGGRRATAALLLASLGVLHVSAQVSSASMPCNAAMDGLLAADPSDPHSYLVCQGTGDGPLGFWVRQACPTGEKFDFISQACAKANVHRKEPALNIAILNNSCARGQQCIGGTVCDLETLKCLCPYGTISQLDTLSCVRGAAPSAPAAAAAPADYDFTNHNFGPFTFSSFGNSNNNQQSGEDDLGGFLPNPSQFVFPAQPAQPAQPVQPSIPMRPAQPAQPAPTTQAPRIVAPGSSCRGGELCTGGSICTFGMCLCPGELEAQGGECVLPAGINHRVHKVGIGAICDEYAECDNDSVCVNGRCNCVAPLIQQDGRCVMRQERVQVGPGEPCDGGEECVRGSICDSLIPVCVCPAHTDLDNGECRPVRPIGGNDKPSIIPMMPYQPQPPAIETLPPTTPPPTYATTQPPPPPTQPPTQPPRPQTYPQTYPTTTTPPPTRPPVTQPPYVPPQTARPVMNTYQTQNVVTAAPAPVVPVIRPSQQANVVPMIQRPRPPMKLGGSKQSGVGVRCSLNTDCMIGAYCNGNTAPPSCQCLSTHVNVDGKCEKVVYPGQTGCRSDRQCSAAYTGTACIDQVCVCPDGHRAIDQTCVPANEPVTSPPGGSCESGRECTGGAVCRQGWCICPDPSMIVQGGICVQSGNRPTVPGQNAWQSGYTQPATPPTTQAPFTQPPPAFKPLAPVGRKAAPGTACGPVDECVSGSMCLDGVCLCPAGLTATENGRCERATTTTTTTQQTPSAGDYEDLFASTARATKAPPRKYTTTAAFIELPAAPSSIRANPANSYAKTNTDNNHIEDDEDEEEPQVTYDDAPCRAKGLICRSNTVCINQSCQCPPGTSLLGDACVGGRQRRKPVSNSRRFVRPGSDCSNGEQCIGGASCEDAPAQLAQQTIKPKKECRCPSHLPHVKDGECAPQPQPQPVVPGERCDANTYCTLGSSCYDGVCRCGPGLATVSGQCVKLPSPTTAAPVTTTTTKIGQRAAPLESCDEGQVCSGGASCDDDTGVCMCPRGQIVFGDTCMQPPERKPQPQPAATPAATAGPTTPHPTLTPVKTYGSGVSCSSDAQCDSLRSCVAGRCTCKPGYADNAGTCEPLETVRIEERPAAVSYAKHRVELLSEEKVEEVTEPPRKPTTTTTTTTPKPTTPQTVQRSPTQKPRISGPPIRRPKPKQKTKEPMKTGSGSGHCPPGNEATKDPLTGKIILCNGLEPNCPPRSYCYVTSGGFAVEEYNCCKSW